MATIKEQIPSQLVLIERSRAVLAEEKENLLKATQANRDLVLSAKKNLYGTLFCFLLICVCTAFLSETYFLVICFAGIILITFWIRRYVLAYAAAQIELASQMTTLLMGAFSKILGVPIELSRGSIYTHTMFKASALATEPFDSIITDDTYTFTAKYPIVVNEIKTTKEVRSGRNTRNVTVFQGTFIEITLPKNFEGKTFVSTEGDKMGMVHQLFWGNVIGGNVVSETTLEWNEFENDLHVAATNGTEARYILTPNFMEDLHEWWLIKKDNIRLVFSRNKLFILMPDHLVKIREVTSETDDEALLHHVLSVVQPLWRAAHLAEDIKL